MVELFIYDGSDINRRDYSYDTSKESPVLTGFKQALISLNPPIPFLVRGLFGDYEDGTIKTEGRKIIKNTFGGEILISLLSTILENGHDKVNSDGRGNDHVHPSEAKLVKEAGLKYYDILWASEYDRIEKAGPYRFFDDIGIHPQGSINDLSIVIDTSFYKPSDKDRILFHQSDIELRRKALLGVIISDTDPIRPKINPLRFTLTEQNLEAVVKNIQARGYFL